MEKRKEKSELEKFGDWCAIAICLVVTSIIIIAFIVAAVEGILKAFTI